MREALVTTSWLEEHLRDHNLRIVDCRWVLGKAGEGRSQYETSHIPGAVYLDMETDLSGKAGRESPGRHPLPAKRDFQKIVSDLGITRETVVIAYDQGMGMPAPRLWWLLRYYGHENTLVLDGGWDLWVKEGHSVDQVIPQFSPADFFARPKKKWVLDKVAVDELRDQPEVLVLDARSPERYRGDVEPIDPKAGHIPGAKNFPYTLTINPATGRFHSPQRLKQEFEKMEMGQVKTIISYCGSGVTACTNLLALYLAGFDGILYEGSWSDWSQDQSLPVQTSC